MPPRVRQPAGTITSQAASKPAVRSDPVAVNKENARVGQRVNSRGPVESKKTFIPSEEDIEEKNIDAKLNRLQDLLKMAKGSV